jgi:hypothetical protein
VIIDVEQQVSPVLVVSHVSVLQVLVAYFRGSPVEHCMSIEVPIHTVIKFTPSRGGGWRESRHQLLPEQPAFQVEAQPTPGGSCELNSLIIGDEVFCSTPIWGDHVPAGMKASVRKLTEFS